MNIHWSSPLSLSLSLSLCTNIMLGTNLSALEKTFIWKSAEHDESLKHNNMTSKLSFVNGKLLHYANLWKCCRCKRFRLNLHMLQVLAAKLRPKKDTHVISICQSTCAKPQRKRFSKAAVTGKIACPMLNAYLKMAKTQCCHSLTSKNTM